MLTGTRNFLNAKATVRIRGSDREDLSGKKRGGGQSLVPTGAHGDHYEQLPLNIWRKLNLREVKSVLSNCDIWGSNRDYENHTVNSI